MMLIGFLVNPIAGMGGRVGLKGTDNVVEEAKRRGAREISRKMAGNFLKNLPCRPFFLTSSGKMGEKLLTEYGFEHRVVYRAEEPTSAEDTKKSATRMLEKGAEMIVFVGGDGTARDIASAVGRRVPVLGIPSGVKMYSSCFSLTPEAGAKLLCEFMEKRCGLREVEILDTDEDAYRKGRFEVKLYSHVKVPYVPDFVQAGKREYFEGDEESAKEEIAEYFVENMERNVLYIIGAGTTTKKIADKMRVKKTLLGVDAYFDGKLVGGDLDEKGILKLLGEQRRAKIVVSPIGAQGFIFGRGNQQISAEVIRKVGEDNIMVVATPQKLRDTPELHVYTGDEKLDRALRKHIRVLTGYGIFRIARVL